MKIIIAAFLLLSCFMAKAESISSPSGNITLEFSINESKLPRGCKLNCVSKE